MGIIHTAKKNLQSELFKKKSLCALENKKRASNGLASNILSKKEEADVSI